MRWRTAPQSAPMSPTSAAFWRVFNLRMIAVVFYFCLLHALSRMMAWYDGEPEMLGNWTFEFVRFTRQTLITGLSILLMMALAEASLAKLRLSGWRRVLLQASFVTGGAIVGTMARIAVASWGHPKFMFMWGCSRPPSSCG